MFCVCIFYHNVESLDLCSAPGREFTGAPARPSIGNLQEIGAADLQREIFDTWHLAHFGIMGDGKILSWADTSSYKDDLFVRL